MKKLKKFYRKNKILVLAITFLFLVITGYFGFYKGNLLSSTTFFQDIGSTLTGVFVSKKVDYQNTTSLQEKSLKEEIVNLKELLNLKTTMAGYEMVYATITSRNTDYWFYTVTIDKGKKDGIEKDMIVINEKGLVGRVIETHLTSSVVKLISANDSKNKVAVDISSKNTTYKGVISGYEIDKNQILVTSIRSNSDIKENDIVTTNGLGTLFPEGILIGQVEEIFNDDLGVSKVLGVKPAVDFENIRYVAVLKRGDEN